MWLFISRSDLKYLWLWPNTWCDHCRHGYHTWLTTFNALLLTQPFLSVRSPGADPSLLFFLNSNTFKYFHSDAASEFRRKISPRLNRRTQFSDSPTFPSIAAFSTICCRCITWCSLWCCTFKTFVSSRVAHLDYHCLLTQWMEVSISVTTVGFTEQT